MTAADAERRLDQAAERLRKLASFNGTYGARLGAEAAYGEAYQVLVRMGERRQLRRRYRR